MGTFLDQRGQPVRIPSTSRVNRPSDRRCGRRSRLRSVASGGSNKTAILAGVLLRAKLCNVLVFDREPHRATALWTGGCEEKVCAARAGLMGLRWRGAVDTGGGRG